MEVPIQSKGFKKGTLTSQLPSSRLEIASVKDLKMSSITIGSLVVPFGDYLIGLKNMNHKKGTT